MNAICERCGGEALDEDGLVEAGREVGIAVSNDTVLVHASDAARGHELENLKGFECSSCGAVYCMSCILDAAPSHRNGGKACFKCHASYQRLT